MNKILLTWYGITDYRASLGFERGGDGPVLGALKSEHYELVLVLGYLNTAKAELPDYSISEVLTGLDVANSPDAQRRFVDETANTPPAHRHYVAWLKHHLADAGITTQVQFHSIPLSDLNDSNGIYKAAHRLHWFWDRSYSQPRPAGSAHTERIRFPGYSRCKSQRFPPS